MTQPKNLSVALLPGLELPASAADHAAIVIDTLRFTTTAAHAIQSGANSIRVVQEIAVARDVATRSGNCAKLCGERDCRPIEGFDFGNSPLEYTSNAVLGHDLVFSTTNGTRAVEATRRFAECFLAALVNRTAVAQAVLRSEIEFWQIVCAGTDGQVAGEDVLAAGAILETLIEIGRVHLINDAARLSLTLWQNFWNGNTSQLLPILESYSGGSNLVRTGYRADIQFASQVDLLDAVPAREKYDLVFRKMATYA
jgi:2-phosphosulfolactate phosphatase